MVGFTQYLNKVTLGALLRLQYIQAFEIGCIDYAVNFDQGCPVDLYLDDVCIGRLNLTHLEIRDGGSANDVDAPAEDKALYVMHYFERLPLNVHNAGRPNEVRGVLQMRINNLPAIHVTGWASWPSVAPTYTGVLLGRWLELDNPEAIRLWRDSLNT